MTMTMSYSSRPTLEGFGIHRAAVRQANAALAILAVGRVFPPIWGFSYVIMPGRNVVELGAPPASFAKISCLSVVLNQRIQQLLADNAPRGFELIQKPYSVRSLSLILRKAIAESSIRRIKA